MTASEDVECPCCNGTPILDRRTVVEDECCTVHYLTVCDVCCGDKRVSRARAKLYWTHEAPPSA